RGAVRDMVTKNELSTERKSFQFAKGKTYFTMVMHNSNFYNYENPGELDSYMQEADSVALTLKNGLLKKTVNVGLYANFNVGDSMEWERFNGTYRADYDKYGILKQTSAKFRMGPSGKQESFKVTRKNGLVTQVIRRRWMKPQGKKGYWQNEEKIVFKYTNKKISKQRYAMMINAAVIGSDNNYYLYYWY
ncbi:MAG: hypothetical protein IKS12_01535, partial [Eubacterium sp.]|nr:hypothetical protein [Eubacterium sp.]